MSTQTSNGPALIFTDGACIGNPGPGGYAAVIQIGDAEQVLVGQEESTTNNRMKMTAAIMALSALPAGLGAVVHSDSEYVVKGVTEWLPGWKQRGWRTAAKKPVLNQDLWERLEALAAARKVTWTWVRGHAGHELNERVDGLANAEAQKAAAANGWVPGSRFGFKPL